MLSSVYKSVKSKCNTMWLLLFQGVFTLMISVTWPKAARNVPMDLLLHLTKHQAHENKTASHALKVAMMKLTFQNIDCSSGRTFFIALF